MKSVLTFKEKKLKKEKITMLTCYDYSTAKIMSGTDIDSLLIGDSLGMAFQGLSDTLPVTVDEIIYHTKAVKRGYPGAFIVADMPFLSYHISPEDAVRNSGRLIKESGASAVKIEGGSEMASTIKALINAKIPVMGHLGLTPQSLNMFGGFKVQGKDYETAKAIVKDALLLESLGVFAIVLECVPEKLSALITKKLSIPTIGIGSGNVTDGQVLVINDILGLQSGVAPKFVKRYADVAGVMENGIKNYIDEVTSGTFPAKEHTFTIDEDIISRVEKSVSELKLGF